MHAVYKSEAARNSLQEAESFLNLCSHHQPLHADTDKLAWATSGRVLCHNTAWLGVDYVCWFNLNYPGCFVAHLLRLIAGARRREVARSSIPLPINRNVSSATEAPNDHFPALQVAEDLIWSVRVEWKHHSQTRIHNGIQMKVWYISTSEAYWIMSCLSKMWLYNRALKKNVSTIHSDNKHPQTYNICRMMWLCASDGDDTVR